jgi:hypothetical protein
MKRFYDVNGNVSENKVNSLITKEYIYDLGRDSAIIHSIIKAHEHGNLDWNSSLALMVVELNRAYTRTQKDLVKYLQLAPIGISNYEL